MIPFNPSSDPEKPGSPEPPPLLPLETLTPSPLSSESAPRPVEEPDTRDHSKKDKEKSKDKDKDKGKKRKKETRRADPWQRYKALHDTLKESQDLVDLADHKARFAVIIMGALNAAIIILGSRSDLLASLPPNLKLWLYVYFGVYATIAIYFLVQAIESLRPRSVPDQAIKGTVSEKEESLGLRFFVDALRYDLPTYQRAWQSVRVSQLNAELATQLHTLATINKAKYNAVAKLYLGLQAITVLTAGLLIALGVAAWVEHKTMTPAPTALVSPGAPASPSGAMPKIKGGKPKKGGWAILGEPERFMAPGVKEPSGVAFSPSRGTLFVVGDEGSLVEIDPSGKLVARLPMGGNLEDVALHTPSGRLVLLSEKKGELIVFDPASGQKTGKFKIDAEALLGEKGVDRNQGFEGLAFRPEAGRPGGGVFYLVHQRLPALMVALAFDPTGPAGSLGADAVIRRSKVGDRDDLTAVTWDGALDRLFVIADSKDRIAMIGVAGDEEAEIVLPGVQQEGLTFDSTGDLWIADDRAGLLRFRGAREKIGAEMKSKPPQI
jgi:uncharacterized protein YjiK